MAIRSFRLYGASETNRVREYVQHQVDAWYAHWCGSDTLADRPLVQLVENDCGPRDGWLSLADDSEDRLSIHRGENALGNLAAFIFGYSDLGGEEPNDSPLEIDFRNSMMADLARRILNQPDHDAQWQNDLKSTTPPHDAWEAGSARRLIRIGVGEKVWAWLLAGPRLLDSIGQASHVTRVTPTLTPLPEALAGQPVRLDLEVGCGRVNLDELNSLAVGDVVPLDRKLTEEIIVRLENGAVVCGAYLGTRNGKIAVQLFPNT
jgi:flagellar motor switch/type III secretory pathway protein FliN